MCPCTPITINPPSGPSGPSIPGFGNPFALDLPNINPFPAGFPEDLLDLLNQLQMLLPPGALLPQLNPNFGKDIFDAIMKLLDQFMPFLMLYKFFLPILNIILCIIEVICALVNPFALPGAIIKLFTVCIPAFLALFPIFALILMIIALILLLIALIEYIILKILQLILALLRNILALTLAFEEGSALGVLAIANKLGALLCFFQNLFVLLALFAIIIQVIKDILGLAFAIPPCDDGSNTTPASDCCGPSTCPVVARTKYTRATGSFRYFPQVSFQADVDLPAPPPNDKLNITVRNETWQLFDVQQSIPQQFINIIDGYDVIPNPAAFPPPFFKPVYFPQGINFTDKTTASQAPYAVDLRLFYNPLQWGRIGVPRFIRFKDCIVSVTPGFDLSLYNNTTFSPSSIVIPTGVVSLVGGTGYEDDGTTQLKGFKDVFGSIQIETKDAATLENFFHKATVYSDDLPDSDDTLSLENIEYTFKPNTNALIGFGIINAMCDPLVSLSKQFVNNVYAGDTTLKTQQLKDLVNSPNFPNPDAAQQCLTLALTGLRNNLTPQGVADFQSTAVACLGKLRDDCNNALGGVIGLGFDPCMSTFTATPKIQFTSKAIKLKLDMNERNGQPITVKIPDIVAQGLAPRIKAHATFGSVDQFVYDGNQSFTANLTSTQPGTGTIMVSFDNNILCANSTVPLSHTLQAIDYQFVYTPAGLNVQVGEGDQSDGAPRRDPGDQGRDSGGGS